MMAVKCASRAAPGHPNEDLFIHVQELVGVFDGVTQPAGVETGCVHGPAWYVGRLAAQVGTLTAPQRKRCGGNVVVARSGETPSLPKVLGDAIHLVRQEHATCDLSSGSTPAADVCLVRASGDRLDYLVLCDTTLVIETLVGLEVIVDNRLHDAVAGLPLEAIAREREKRKLVNQPAGYWIAAAAPEAAQHAVTGSLPLIGPNAVTRVALLTDGAARAVDTFALFDWHGLLDLVADRGPAELIRLVREAERLAPEHPLHKCHDDATVAFCLFG